ncbi:unnamed protein product [Musa hybrid cultivar]
MGSQFPPKSPLLESTNRGQKQRSEIEADPEEERRGREIESIEGRLLIRVPFTDGGSLRFSSHAINGMAYGDNEAWKVEMRSSTIFGNPICIYLDRNCPNLQIPSPILVSVTSDWVRS